MNLYQLFVILKARKLLAFFIFVLTVSIVTAISLKLPKKYVANTTLILNYTGVDPITGSRIVLPGYMATQIDIIKSDNVSLKVVERLKLYTNPAYIDSYYKATDGQVDIQNWLASIVKAGLIVIPSKESSVLTIAYESTDPRYAATMANAYSEAYIETSLEMKVQPSKRTAEWFGAQVEQMRNDLMVKQQNLSNYQREKNIVSIDERLDVENSRLSQLSQQLGIAQAELFSLQSQANAITNGQLNSELINDPMVKDLQRSITSSEVAIDELKQRVSANHPDYIAAVSELRSLKRKLIQEIGSAKIRIESAVTIASQKVDELANAIDQQKALLLSISEDRNQLAILKRDLDTADQVFSLALQRLNETTLEGELNESDVSILTMASTPITHSKPKIPLLIVLSVFLGLILAVGIVFLVELLNRRVRVVEDLIELGVPIIGNLPYSKQ
ncbi:MAG: chain length determinant protein EpsF [Pseudomonadota bacterium]|nr:chain length determinant protein EpsF [Pseudomonadota bacterium]